jgi:RND family efflux transporter MFP subunit
MNARALRTPLLILVLAIAVAVLLVWLKPVPVAVVPQQKPLLVDVLEVERRTLAIKVKAQGIVQPSARTSLVSEVSGRIVEVTGDFNAGGFFRSGDILLRIDARDYEARLQQAAALVAQAESMLAQERGRAEVASREWRQRSGRNKISEQARELALRKPQLLDAEAQLQSAKAGMRQAQLDLERTVIVAPYDGLVSAKNADIGQFIAAGSPIAEIMALSDAEVRLAIPEGKLSYLSLPDAYGGASPDSAAVELSHSVDGERRTWQASLVRSEGVVDQRSRSLFVVARVRDPYGIYEPGGDDFTPLRFGMFIDASVEGRRVDNVIPLPRAVVRPGNQVWVVDDNNRLLARKVSLLRTDGPEIFVTAGLDDGDRVCLTSLGPVLPGTLVSISSVLRQSDPGAGSGELRDSELATQPPSEPAGLRPAADPGAPSA